MGAREPGLHRMRGELQGRWPRVYPPGCFLSDPALDSLVPQGQGQKLLLGTSPGPDSSRPHHPQPSGPPLFPLHFTLCNHSWAAPCGQYPALAISVSSILPRIALRTLSRVLTDVYQAPGLPTQDTWWIASELLSLPITQGREKQ